MKPIRIPTNLVAAVLALATFTDLSSVVAQQNPTQAEDAVMAGYLLVPNARAPEAYNAGFSMYVAAWPLLDEYPGQRFQTGLFGTWMHPHYETKPEERLYSDIEGGLGWWRDTRFATETPKFIMGGVTLNFRSWANGPGAGKGRSWEKPQGKYGIAQLSPNVLWPPDGLNLKQGTSGQLFGYGYLPLPLTEPKTQTAGQAVPTGDQSWTLFLNTKNFKGPVTFFTPFFWSEVTAERPELSGMFLDTRPSQTNRPLQMETQYVPSIQANDGKGNTFARVAPIAFPSNKDGNSVVVHRITSYDKSALWDQVESWFNGGKVAKGRVDSKGAKVHSFPGHGGATWRIYGSKTPKEERSRLAWSSFAKPTAFESDTFGYQWNRDWVQTQKSSNGSLIELPQYYRLAKEGNKATWIPIQENQVPDATGLREASLPRPPKRQSDPYVTPDDPDSCWKTPGPAAGPFKSKLGDGSTVTYYWYRFADQPAILNADFTDAEREQLQKRVEMIHRNWKSDRDYLPPPKTGNLAELDPAVLVTPPKGLEVGYVPIVTRQEIEK